MCFNIYTLKNDKRKVTFFEIEYQTLAMEKIIKNSLTTILYNFLISNKKVLQGLIRPESYGVAGIKYKPRIVLWKIENFELFIFF